MSNYRVKHFSHYHPVWLESDINEFIKNNNIEVLKYTMHFLGNGSDPEFIGVLEYEELDHED